MRDRWNEIEATGSHSEVAEFVLASRLFGSDPTLVLHGGGNTSLKAPFVDVTGDEVDALYVKGSGRDLATIELSGFAALRIARLGALLRLDSLSDGDMMRALADARCDSSDPLPSVETFLHALLPHKVVFHSHSDAVLTLTNLADGEARVRSLYGARAVVLPYVMPGFGLAKQLAEIWPGSDAHDATGIVLMNHGLVTFGDTTSEAYHRHVEMTTLADEYLADKAPLPEFRSAPPLPPPRIDELAKLRRGVSTAAGRSMVTSRYTDGIVRWFVAREDLMDAAERGPVTPDHVIRTKRVPQVGLDVEAYVDAYRETFDAYAQREPALLSMVDPAPRIILDPHLGMVSVGAGSADAAIASEIYHHSMAVITQAETLGRYTPLPATEAFAVEYWEPERAKLAVESPTLELQGEVALVTGAASGIGRACAAELISRGAAVVGIDMADAIAETFSGSSWLGIQVDVTDADGVDAVLREAVDRYGGIDIAVMAAGIFGASRPLAQLDRDEWDRVMAVNVGSVASLMARLHPLLALAFRGGRVVMVASKNVAAPGPGAAAYSASKAAVTQLARVAALEWAHDGIRVNCVHPDAVFDTGLWTAELLAERAAHYNVSVEQYRRRNLLQKEVTSAAVGRLVAEMCGETFAVTTGAQVPIDGGSERVI